MLTTKHIRFCRVPKTKRLHAWIKRLAAPLLFLFLTTVGRGSTVADFDPNRNGSIDLLAQSQTPIPPRPRPIDPNNILVSIGPGFSHVGPPLNVVREFTPTGWLVQTIPFNYNGTAYPGTENLRDIVVGSDGVISSFNGTFSPFLTHFSSDTTTYSHWSFRGWSTANVLSYGGIASYRSFIFVTDTSTSGGTPWGIVRFDIPNNAAVRFASDAEFRDLNVGLDGKLYALSSGGSPVYVYDPVSLAFLRNIPLPADIVWRAGASIAVDKKGRVFACGSDGVVYRLSPDGSLEASKATGFTSLMDIDVDESGRLIIGQTAGRVIIGDSDLLTDFTSFPAVHESTAPGSLFVSFAKPR